MYNNFYYGPMFTVFQEYDRALKYTNGILAVEPKNHQANQLKDYIEKKMKRGNLINFPTLPYKVSVIFLPWGVGCNISP